MAIEAHVVHGADIVCVKDESFACADVRAIAVFKRDIFAVDLICMQFELPDRS